MEPGDQPAPAPQAYCPPATLLMRSGLRLRKSQTRHLSARPGRHRARPKPDTSLAALALEAPYGPPSSGGETGAPEPARAATVEPLWQHHCLVVQHPRLPGAPAREEARSHSCTWVCSVVSQEPPRLRTTSICCGRRRDGGRLPL